MKKVTKRLFLQFFKKPVKEAPSVPTEIEIKEVILRQF
jgi:hypothetical protein